jgi:hypothetical protein
MKLREGELEILIKESVNGKFVDCSFGPRGVTLNDTEENEWAKKRVLEIRNPVAI